MKVGIALNVENVLKKITPNNHNIISTRYHRIVRSINSYYWGIDSSRQNCRYVGSYGRGTAIDGFSDVDMIVVLPETYYERFRKYQHNGQSALIQNVKRALNFTYSRSFTKGDGQVIVIEFSDGIKFEIVPAFKIKDTYTYPDSNESGSWKKCNPLKEIEAVNLINKYHNGKLKNLCKLTRAWKKENNINISGILIDALASMYMLYLKEEQKSWDYKFLFTDFLNYLGSQFQKNSWLICGSWDVIQRNNMEFEDCALQSASYCIKAMKYEFDKDYSLADTYWEKIFGNVI